MVLADTDMIETDTDILVSVSAKNIGQLIYIGLSLDHQRRILVEFRMNSISLILNIKNKDEAIFRKRFLQIDYM